MKITQNALLCKYHPNFGASQKFNDKTWIRCNIFKFWQTLITLATTSGVIFYGNAAIAQIVPDGTIGAESSVVTPNIDIKGLPSDRIDGGATRGANLFHSFREFNVREGRGAYFSNPTGIENIFSRVTGRNASNIDGKLGVLGNANLFLLNPNGILFGPNASLDLNGSFLGSTANSLRFGDGKEFSASNPTAPPLLSVNVPLGVQFNQGQPNAIANFGNLSAGQNLTLLGGTVVSTGNLSAPGGQISIAAVPGDSSVNLSPSAQLLNIATPSSGASGNSSSIAELIKTSNLPGLTVNNNEQVELADSGLFVVDGDVVAKNVTAQTATLTAHHNLTLVESQIGTTSDLNLLAGDTVRVRDSVVNPFVAQAGGNLTIQGDKSIDILALNHPQIPFVSGGNLSLLSNGIISGDAHFSSGGNFSILNLSGSGGNFVSLYDPIVRSNGNVEIGNYTGASLKIEAAGNITTNAITINRPETPANVNNNDPDFQTLTGGNALILRAGSPFTGDLLEPNPLDGASSVTYTLSSPEGSLTINGNITSAINPVNNNLTPDPLSVELQAKGDINTQDITTNGGAITITSQQGSISARQIQNRASIGEAGAINITAEQNVTLNGEVRSLTELNNLSQVRDIIIESKNGFVSTQQISSSVFSGTGGNIDITAKGNITTNGKLESFVGNNGEGDAGNVSLTSTEGNIVLNRDIESSTPRGTGGNIDITAKGNITTNDRLGSFVDTNGEGDAGNVSLTSTEGNIVLNGDIVSSTPSGTGGDITLSSGLTDGEITVGLAPGFGEINTTSRQISAQSFDGVAGDVTLSAAGNIRSGNIEASSNSNEEGFSTIEITSLDGSVFLNRSRLNTSNNGSDFAGDINIIAENGNIEIIGSNVVRNPDSIPDIESNGDFGIISIISGGNVSFRDTLLSAIVRNTAQAPARQEEGRTLQSGEIDVISINGNIEITNSDLTARTESIFANPGNIFLTADRGKVLIQQNSLVRTNIEENAGIIDENDSLNRDFGNVDIFANSVEIRGSEVTAASESLARAGIVFVEAQKSVVISGTATNNQPRDFSTTILREGLFAEATLQRGIAGDIGIITDELTVENGAKITVTSPGLAGNIDIFANKMFLDNGALNATTGVNGNGANINLRGDNNSSLDFIILWNESKIEANATLSATGGNIDINSKLLIALPPKGAAGSDITANALGGGSGGRVNIRAAIYGISRSRETPDKILGNSQNDIAATSQAGAAGNVSFGEPIVNPNRGLIQLPEDLGDSSNLIAPSCPVGGQQATSQFVITGRGGLPPNPASALSSGVLVGNPAAVSAEQASPTPTSPVEAKGVSISPNGEIILTANPSKLASYSSWQRFTGCNEQ
ncbi:MAG: filamentous hemagglutinin N-terminal domain-containing protein [Nostoc sp. SerVER01]|nr:filamentous hemagglutinin N-terminal domain-containing protein [Nostoc sp. SerVER01]